MVSTFEKFRKFFPEFCPFENFGILTLQARYLKNYDSTTIQAIALKLDSW